MRLIVVIVLMWLTAMLAHGQTHTMFGSNVVPAGASLTIQSGASITAAAGSTVTGFGTGGGSVAWGGITGTLSAQTDLNTALSGKQPLDSDLTSIAALTTTSFGRSFLTLADAAAGRTYIGATTVGSSLFTMAAPSTQSWIKVDGTGIAVFENASLTRTSLGLGTAAQNNTGDFQAADSDLASIAALTTTSFGRAFLTQADAAASRTYIGAGTSSFDGTFTSLTGKPTTLSGYGITDAQPLDADLTTWAGITPAAGVGTFLATPSSVNLRAAITDETGTGALVFASNPNLSSGFTIDSAAPSGKILISTAGISYGPSTPNWPIAAGTAGHSMMSDGTNFVVYPDRAINSNTASSGSISTSDFYIVGSNVAVAAGDFKAKAQYHCIFDVTKSAGTGAIVITLRIGTTGSTSDAAIQTYTFGAGTSVADTGTFEIFANFRSVGSGTSAVVQGFCRGQHNLATTGLFNNVTFVTTIIGSPSPSSGFNSSTATTIGVSFNGSTAFAGNSQMVHAQLIQ